MLRLYLNHNVSGAVLKGLRRRRVDVIAAFEDGADELPDDQLLDRASALDRVLVSHDEDLLREATQRQRTGSSFVGLVFCHQERLDCGRLIDELELIAGASAEGELRDRVLFLSS